MIEFTTNELNWLEEIMEEKIAECKEDGGAAAMNDLKVFESILNKLEGAR